MAQPFVTSFMIKMWNFEKNKFNHWNVDYGNLQVEQMSQQPT